MVASAGGSSDSIADADNDTKIQVEESSDDDIIRFDTAGTERHRVGNTGKASWAAGGVGAVGTQTRDFTFYTEGSSNGVAIHSNDERLIFMGAAASSGTGVDTGYLQIENGGTAKIALNSNGDSYFIGGNVGIGESSPAAPLHVEHDSSTAYNGAAEITESLIVSNKNGTDNSGVNNVASIGLHVADGATSQGFINYVRTGNNTGDFTLTQRTASTTYAEAMRINNAGQITAPLQPAFDAAKNNGYQADDNNFVQDQVRTNVGSHYNSSNGRFTAPVDGQYLVMFRIFTHDSGGVVQAEVTLKKNSGDAFIARAHKVGGYHTPVQITKVITLSANDYLYTYVGDSGTSSGWMGSAGEYNYFCAFLIG